MVRKLGIIVLLKILGDTVLLVYIAIFIALAISFYAKIKVM
jgi:hypothetical protein